MLEHALAINHALLPWKLLRLESSAWRPAVQKLRKLDYRLLTLLARSVDSSQILESCWAQAGKFLVIDVQLSAGECEVQDIADLYPVAARLQRTVHELSGLRFVRTDEQFVDQGPWLNHGWSDQVYPLADLNTPIEFMPVMPLFTRVEGAGVHEVPVGPVHAGTIEPGHFRFSVVGEKVLRLQQRLGYCHRGMEALWVGQTPAQALRLAGRACGDSTVAGSWAFAMAIEQATGLEVSSRAGWLRAIMLERERIAAHLSDLGALAQDAGWVMPQNDLSGWREEWLREHHAWCGHRLMMDQVVLGGCACDLSLELQQRWLEQGQSLMQRLEAMFGRFEDHGGLQDRLLGTGILSPERARQLGVCGLVGRASGQSMDVRCDLAYEPYSQLKPARQVLQEGDVAARVRIRFAESFSSLFLLGQMLEQLPEGPVRTEPATVAAEGRGYGWVEAWRGEVVAVVHLQQGRISRARLHDPSWQNWPALEYAVLDNILADFPLINKSFSLAYAGHDL